eukprot:scaffold341003_cov34-Prasinocladus_malaysianus.AAC.1
MTTLIVIFTLSGLWNRAMRPLKVSHACMVHAVARGMPVAPFCFELGLQTTCKHTPMMRAAYVPHLAAASNEVCVSNLFDVASICPTPNNSLLMTCQTSCLPTALEEEDMLQKNMDRNQGLMFSEDVNQDLMASMFSEAKATY